MFSVLWAVDPNKHAILFSYHKVKFFSYSDTLLTVVHPIRTDLPYSSNLQYQLSNSLNFFLCYPGGCESPMSFVPLVRSFLALIQFWIQTVLHCFGFMWSTISGWIYEPSTTPSPTPTGQLYPQHPPAGQYFFQWCFALQSSDSLTHEYPANIFVFFWSWAVVIFTLTRTAQLIRLNPIKLKPITNSVKRCPAFSPPSPGASFQLWVG